jgi:catechol 2,3-dioxygenase-like lactoylglutathione lyase family enzyme
MKINTKSIRPFIGSKNFDLSRSFYRDLGFEEVILSDNMSVFKTGEFGFYLQDAYVKDWIDNSMIFMEVENVEQFWEYLQTLDLPSKFENVRQVPIRKFDWGSECYLHDPSGILWHFGEFVKLKNT